MELTDGQRDFLGEPRFAVAATISRDGTPHQTVVWYALDGEEVVVSTPRGSRKHKHLLRDPRLSLCVEDGFRYVTVGGRVTVEDEPEAAGELYARMGRRYQGAATGPPGGGSYALDPKAAELLMRERVTLRMSVDRVRSSGFG